MKPIAGPTVPEILSEADLLAFAEGRLDRADRLLGARLETRDGRSGVRFAVWAPNAVSVSVVGHFNGWDGAGHAMRPRHGGVWELFVPGLKAGEVYKRAMNDKFVRATQAGRVTMNQMLTEIRRADSVSVTPTGERVDVIRPQPSRLPNETYRSFWYDAANKQMKLQIHYAPPAPLAPYDSPWYSLARNVHVATFGPPETQLDANNTLAVTRVPVQLVVKIGNNEVRLSGSSGPRRAARE